MLAETGQEVPGWLQNISTRHAPYGAKAGRRGGGRFGGRDFRKDHGGTSGYAHQRVGGYSGGYGGGGGGYGGGGGGYGGGGYGGYGGGGSAWD